MKKNVRRMISLMLVLCMAVSMVVLPTYATDLRSILDVDAATTEKIYFKCETNKDFTTYAVGDEMVFTLTLYAQNTSKQVEALTAPYFYYSIRQDDGRSYYGFADATSGSAVIRTKLTSPGAVLLKVLPYDSAKKEITVMKGETNLVTPMNGGAIAGVSEITTTLEEPEGFDAFWAEQLELLDTCAPEMYSIEKLESWWGKDTYDAYIVKINCVGNSALISTGETYVSGVLTVPKNADPSTLKFNLGFQGYGVSACWISASAEYVNFVVSAHSMDPYEDADYYTALGRTLGVSDSDYGWSAAENADPYTSYFRYMLLRDVQAVRFLQKYFGEGGAAPVGTDTALAAEVESWSGLWDNTNIRTSGGSQGGFQAIATAALVPQVTECAASIPWFADVGAQTVNTRISSGFLPSYADGLLFYDTANFAKRVKAVVKIDAGAGDPTCPMWSIQSIFNNLTTDATLTFTQGRTHSRTNTVEINYTETKSLTISVGDTYALPFAVKETSDPGLVSIEDGVLTAVKGGVCTVTYENGIERTFNIEYSAIGGDANDDSAIDIKDAVLLAQYLAEWDVTINEAAADCNGDGNVDIKDAVLLAQYLAEWDVELVGGKPSHGGTTDDDPQDGDREIEADDIF